MYVRLRDEGMTRIARVVQAELTHFPELAQFYFDEVILRSRRLVEQVLERGVGQRRVPESAARVRGPRPGLAPGPHRPRAVLLPRLRSRQALGDEQALDGLLDLYLHGVLARPGEER